MKRAPATGVVVSDFLGRVEDVLQASDAARTLAMAHIPCEHQDKIREMRRDRAR